MDSITKIWRAFQNPPAEENQTGSRILNATLILHALNTRLWKLEDQVRDERQSPDEIARLKREIDRKNLLRNLQIQHVDVAIIGWLSDEEIIHNDDACLSTESPGQVLDRLSILCLRQQNIDRLIASTSRTKNTRQCKKRKSIKFHVDDQVTYLLRAAGQYMDGIRNKTRTFRMATALKCYGASDE